MNLKIFVIIGLFPVLCKGQAVKDFKQLSDRVNITLEDRILSISPLAENAVRIRYYKETEGTLPELILTSGIPNPEFQVSDLSSKLEIKVKGITVVLDKQTGVLSFADNSGKIFLSEKAGSRKLIPDSVMGEPCFLAEQSFESPADEYIFGLGQFQDGHYNIKGVTRRLTQVNTRLPFLLFIQAKDMVCFGISMGLPILIRPTIL